MDQTKRSNDVSRDDNEQAVSPALSKEVRTLNDLELVICGGGDGIIHWPN